MLHTFKASAYSIAIELPYLLLTSVFVEYENLQQSDAAGSEVTKKPGERSKPNNIQP